MSIDAITPRRAASLGLLALVPAVAYVVGRGDPAVVVAAVNVVLIVSALYVALSPVSDGGGENGAADRHEP